MHRGAARYAREPEGDEALLVRHAALVDRVARRVAGRMGRPELAEDLWSAGALGLLEAAKRFDGARETSFEGFAEHRIRGAMLDEIRKMDHLPRRLRTQVESARKARRALAQELGREATSDELAERLELPPDEVQALELLAEPLVPLEEAVLGGEDGPAEARLQLHDVRKALAAGIAALPERLQLVLSLHYVEGLTYREVAEILEVSEPRVCQLHGAAIQALRQTLGARKDELR